MTIPRRYSGRARVAIFWGAAWFVMIQVVVGFVLRSRPEFADREFGHKLGELRHLRAQAPNRALLLMLGSSRVATGFRPDSFHALDQTDLHSPLVYNFAQVGSGPEMAHLSLSRLLEAGIRPDWVFIEFWAPTWTTERNLKEFSDQINLGCLNRSDLRVLSHYVPEKRISTLQHLWLTKQIVPLYSNRSVILERLAPQWLIPVREPDHRCQNLDSRGWWSPRWSITEQERKTLSERYQQHYGKRLRSYETASNPDRALRATLSLCQREQIRATVVVLPEANNFRQVYPETTTKKVQGYLETLRQDFKNVDVVDARSWVDDQDFMDGHHLLPSGALVFSRRLESEVLQPMLAGAALRVRR